MTKEEAKKYLMDISYQLGTMSIEYLSEKDGEKMREAIETLQQEPCEMTAEEYRQRMIQAFHNADCDELIAICVLPTEKEFEHLEWLLEKHYKAKPEPCEDVISRANTIDEVSHIMLDHPLDGYEDGQLILKTIQDMPPVTPADDKCQECKKDWTKCGKCPVMMKWVKEFRQNRK